MINCGVSGYGTRQERDFYELFASRYQPDVVLLLMTDNDSGAATDEQESGRLPYREYERLFLTTRLVRSALRSLWSTGDFTDSARALAELANATTATESKLGVVLFRIEPLTRAWNDLVAAVSTATGGTDVPMVDVGTTMLKDYRPEALHVHPADHRPNEIAHQIAAEEIERFLARTDLLTPRAPQSAFSESPYPGAPTRATR